MIRIQVTVERKAVSDHFIQMDVSTRDEFNRPFIVSFLVHQCADEAQFIVLYQTQIHRRLLPKNADHHNRASLARVGDRLCDRILDADTFQNEVGLVWAKVFR